MKNCYSATRRKRRTRDERRLGTARGERQTTRSLEQSLDLLRQPQASHEARGAAASSLQRAIGNAQVTRMLVQREQAEQAVQRYPVGVAENASCDEVIQWIDANSPYAPEWAHTEGNLRRHGDFRITGNASSGFRLRVGNPRATLDGPHVDMPNWRPFDLAMRRAWQRAYRTLRAHEAHHEQIARQWRQRLQRRLAKLDLRVEASSREEVEAQANDLINAEWNQWIAEYQDAQHAIDPFTATLDCPNP